MQETKQEPFVRSDDAPRQEVEPGITRQVLAHDPSLMLVRVAFRKGTRGDLHTHPHRQITYVESGRFEVTVDGRTQVLSTGDSYLAAPGVPHGVVALEDGSLIDAFTPQREDFLA